MHPVEQGLAAVVALLTARGADGRTCWVGVDGLGASGKTTFTGRLAAALPGAVVVHVDGFARPGAPTWDHQLFSEQVLEPLLAGRPARWTEWDPYTGRPGQDRTAEPGRPVLVEGVSATDRRVPVPWDVTVWVETPAEVRAARARARDGEQVWRERWLAEWIPSEQAYLREQRPDLRADVVVAGG
ncbi:hypothetical protein GC722_10225 [Auraticoccus sp. F435]|uniref:Uridine kinase n=1 Tax=Auraticoccus cholistanensis TaxID=2656650 RepID=A0A6A9UTY5_9ACTN|nr:hypothetical protein [Auraticoccus cholistanensis]MVA76396.1 hypothetical protein [Auraticoccus cholistanensis]